MRSRNIVFAALIVACAFAILVWKLVPVEGEAKPKLGLLTSLPIYWSDQGDIAAALKNDAAPHRVRSLLEDNYQLVPLDVLAAQGEVIPSKELAALDFLMLAQPAPLPPQDFVALDYWVRGGGRLLLFADPVLTEDSHFGIGDKRRPQDIAMMGPILTRWGLSQALVTGANQVEWNGAEIPIDAGGAFADLEGDKADCVVSGGGIVASCRIGKGTAIIVGDAAMLGAEITSPQADKALETLLASAFE